eukprot:COSAG01_NODE_3138_length_6526_cov_478.100202_1_plen_89_part_00
MLPHEGAAATLWAPCVARRKAAALAGGAPSIRAAACARAACAAGGGGRARAYLAAIADASYIRAGCMRMLGSRRAARVQLAIMHHTRP